MTYYPYYLEMKGAHYPTDLFAVRLCAYSFGALSSGQESINRLLFGSLRQELVMKICMDV